MPRYAVNYKAVFEEHEEVTRTSVIQADSQHEALDKLSIDPETYVIGSTEEDFTHFIIEDVEKLYE